MKKIIAIVILTVLMISAVSCNNAPVSAWTKVYGEDTRSEMVSSLIGSADGGFMIQAAWNQMDRVDDVYYTENIYSLSRYNNDGEDIWNHDFEEFSEMGSVFQNDDGSVTVFGFSHPPYTENFTEHWFYTVTMVKLDNEGREVWSKDIGNEFMAGGSVRRTANDTFVLSGYNWDTEEFRLMMLDENGDELWDIPVETGKAERRAVQLVNDDGILVRGYLRDTDEFQFIMLDSAGNPVREKTIKIPGEYGSLMGIINLQDGDFLATWMYKASAFNRGIYIAELNEKFDMVWGKALEDERDNQLSGMSVTANGDIMLVMNVQPDNMSLETDYDIRVVRLDADGTLRWDRTFGERKEGEYVHAFGELADGQIVFIGSVYLYNGPVWHSDHSFVLKLDQDGEETSLWTLEDSDSGVNNYVRNLLVLPDGSFIVAGSVPGPEANGRSQNDIFITKYGSDDG